MYKIKTIPNSTILVILIIIIFVLLIDRWRSKIIVHKVMNYNQYSIVIISRFPFISEYRNVYADIWLHHKITKEYFLCVIGSLNDYDYHIKDITILPESEEIKVEFHEYTSHNSKSGTGVDLYKIE
jgi:hypothetical protein